jgi:FkbM family methyltransferase
MIKEGLIELRNSGFYPSGVLDIGANVGSFTKMCKTIWPFSKYVMIEGNEECKNRLSSLGDPYYISLLGNSDGKKIEFYKTKISRTGTGNSIYREKTKNYNDENVIIERRELITLNTLLGEYDYKIEFAKIDTQGSELDVLSGGDKILKNCQFILLEVSLKYYNEGVPLKKDVLNFMEEYGYKEYKPIEDHIWNSPNKVEGINPGEIFQQDILFIKK